MPSKIYRITCHYSHHILCLWQRQYLSKVKPSNVMCWEIVPLCLIHAAWRRSPAWQDWLVDFDSLSPDLEPIDAGLEHEFPDAAPESKSEIRGLNTRLCKLDKKKNPLRCPFLAAVWPSIWITVANMVWLQQSFRSRARELLSSMSFAHLLAIPSVAT